MTCAACSSSQVMLGVRNLKVHLKFVGGREILAPCTEGVKKQGREKRKSNKTMNQIQEMFTESLKFPNS